MIDKKGQPTFGRVWHVCNLDTKLYGIDFQIHLQLSHKIKGVVKFPSNILQMRYHMILHNSVSQRFAFPCVTQSINLCKHLLHSIQCVTQFH
jgi:hypothetical protein